MYDITYDRWKEKNVASTFPKHGWSAAANAAPLLWQKPSLLVRQDNYSAERSALRSFRRGNTCSQFSATRGIYAHGERYIYLYAACQDTWYGTSQPCQRLFIFATLSSLSLSLTLFLLPPRNSSPYKLFDTPCENGLTTRRTHRNFEWRELFITRAL